jgi:7-cyano-7-deazaguanine synthase in queuosine biosynthesis
VTEALIRCDSAILPDNLNSRTWERDIQISHMGPSQDLNLKIENISHSILQNPDSLSSDFLRIGAYIYSADQAISRGGVSDIYGKHWLRNFTFLIPVQNADFWEQAKVKSQLCKTLSYLTGDLFNFIFSTVNADEIQLMMNFTNKEKLFFEPDSVILFSGGADSLCAVVEAVGSDNKRPILVSHSPSPKHNSTQRKLVEALGYKFKGWPFPRIRIWIHRTGLAPQETSQRSRSFLYAILGAIVAAQLNIHDIFYADNGIVSLNLPKSSQTIGTYASRSTHPKYLYEFQRLCELIFPGKFKITNPLLFKTRAEALSMLKLHNCEALLQETISCANSRGRPNITPHCGTCSQCIDRRFGSLAANLEKHDLAVRYETDIFSDALKEGFDRTQAESYVRFASQIDSLGDDDIFEKIPQIMDAITPNDTNPDDTASKLVDLLRRHSAETRQVIKDQLLNHNDQLYDGTLPDTCLLRLVVSGSNSKNDKIEYITKLGELLKITLPKSFGSRLPADESEIQEAADAIFTASCKDLSRELPLLPFAGVCTKPDFGNMSSGKTDDWLFVEMKYPKQRRRLNRIITEITSRITIYQKQGAFVLFGIYDNPRTIRDDEQFIGECEAITDKVKVSIIR